MSSPRIWRRAGRRRQRARKGRSPTEPTGPAIAGWPTARPPLSAPARLDARGAAPFPGAT